MRPATAPFAAKVPIRHHPISTKRDLYGVQRSSAAFTVDTLQKPSHASPHRSNSARCRHPPGLSNVRLFRSLLQSFRAARFRLSTVDCHPLPLAPNYYSALAFSSSSTSPLSYAESAPSTSRSQPKDRSSPSPAHPRGSTNPYSASADPPLAPSVAHFPAELSCPGKPQAATQGSPPAPNSQYCFSAFLLPFARGPAPRVSLPFSPIRPDKQAKR